MADLNSVLCARLLALIARHGKTVTGVASDMGRSHTWLLHKVKPQGDRSRGMRIGDIDAVLAHLGESHRVMFSPVLLDGDQAVLAHVARGGISMEDLRRLFVRGPEAAERLIGQALIAEVGERLELTDEGSRWISCF